MTWRDYEANLEPRLRDLHDRVQRGAYRALPARRSFIPKGDGTRRPLAISTVEDKIVQRAAVEVLNAIYEGDFLGFSYGFRPGRGAHDALDALCVGIVSTKVSYILDADIRSFFDSVRPAMAHPFPGAPDRRPAHASASIQKWLEGGCASKTATVSAQ